MVVLERAVSLRSELRVQKKSLKVVPGMEVSPGEVRMESKPGEEAMKSLCAGVFSEVSQRSTDVRETLLNAAVALGDKFMDVAISCPPLMF